MIAGWAIFLLGTAVACYIGAAQLDPKSPWDSWLLAGGTLSLVAAALLGIQVLLRRKMRPSTPAQPRMRYSTELAGRIVETVLGASDQQISDEHLASDLGLHIEQLRLILRRLEQQGRVNVSGHIVSVLPALEQEAAGDITPRPGTPGFRGWTATWRVIQDPKRNEVLCLEVKSSRSTAPEELRCVVIEPGGTAVHARAPKYRWNVDGRDRKKRYLYPSDFQGAEPTWPPRPGDYEVRWLAIRAQGKGALKPLERVLIATSQCKVHPDGRVTRD